MKYVGPHVSAGGGLYNAPLNAVAVGASAFALFTKTSASGLARRSLRRMLLCSKRRLQQAVSNRASYCPMTAI